MDISSIRNEKSQVGFEFEFIRDSKVSLEEIQAKIKSIFKVNVRIENEHHSDFIPTEIEWKMEPDYSGGKNLVELVTGPIPYKSARIILLRMLKWIRDDSSVYLSDRCGLHININLSGPYIESIDILKYILKFDESLVYKHFPERENNIYTKTIKSIYPRHGNYDIDSLKLVSANYVYPSTKYYGINFTKLAKSYLEFRYIGGKEYANKAESCLLLMNYFIDSLIISYSEDFTDRDKTELKSIVNKKDLLFKACKNIFTFRNIFKGLKLMVDGKEDDEIIKSYFHKIIEVLLPLFKRMEKIDYSIKGIINYDSDQSFLEISGSTIKETTIDSLRVIIYDSVIVESIITNSFIVDSTIELSDLTNTDTESCKVISSRLKDGYHKDCSILDSYINGKFIAIDESEIKGNTIFREGKWRSCKIEKSVEIIDAEENIE